MAEHNWSELGPAEGAGPLLRQARVRKGVSLRELARRIQVSPGTLSAIETGKTRLTLDRLDKIGAALGTTTLDILTVRATPAAMPGGAGATYPGSEPHWRTFEPLDLDPALKAAISTFVATGYHGATMRIIAANATMSVPGVYHYYPSKQHLIVAVLDLAMAELHWRVPAARSDGDGPVERFANIVEALALFHTHRSDLAFLGASEMRSLEEPDRSRIAALRNEIQYLLDDEVAAGVRAGEFTTAHPHHAARAVSTMCTSLPQWFRPDGRTTPEQISAEYAGFAVDMMRGRR